MRENPKPFEIYRHFKGNQYQILTLAKDTEDGRTLVVYQALYGDYGVYARELSQFMSLVDREKYPDVQQTYRFEKADGRAEMQPAETEREQTAGMQMSETQPVETEREQAAGMKMPEMQPAGNASEVQVTEQTHKEQADTGEFVLDPMVEAFLDTDALDEKLNILAGLHHRMTKEMLATMAVVSDIELNEGSVEEQYVELRDYLLMKEKFECKRIW